MTRCIRGCCVPGFSHILWSVSFP